MQENKTTVGKTVKFPRPLLESAMKAARLDRRGFSAFVRLAVEDRARKVLRRGRRAA